MKIEYNSDGSLKVPGAVQKSTEIHDYPHTKVIQLLLDLPYSMGKKYLSEILRGDETVRIKKSGFNRLDLFGTLAMYADTDIYNLLAEMQSKGFIKVERGGTSGFLPLLVVTDKGKKELTAPEDIKRPPFEIDEVTNQDREVFKNLGYLEKYNDEQKKGIVSPASKLLCIAGAGSGKTTVLTKRIEFLVKYKLELKKDVLENFNPEVFKQKFLADLQKPVIESEIIDTIITKIMSFLLKLNERDKLLLR